MLTEENSQWFTEVLHYIIRLEYQQRGTIHFRVAIWCLPKHVPSHYKGRTGATMADRQRPGHQDTSPFHSYLEGLFSCHIDVQWTTGRLNYISGYTTKAQDSMDFRLDAETSYGGQHGRWLTAYRLLNRKTVCVPEVALWFHEAEPMVRSFRIWKCYAPIPWTCDRKNNDSERLYEFYLLDEGLPKLSFLEYCRIYKVVGGQLKSFSSKQGKATISIGVRYSSEMRDHFIGQLASMLMPHCSREQLYPEESGTECSFPYVRCLLGLLSYLLSLSLNDDGTIRIGNTDKYAAQSSFLVPLPIRDGLTSIFSSRAHALDYIDDLLFSELTVRSMPRDRISSAQYRLLASYLLATEVVAPADRALWNRGASGTIKEVTLSDDQKLAMNYWLRHFDVCSAEDHLRSIRELHIIGKPGSGKTELFVQFCAHAITQRLRVLILCTTGQLVPSYRQRLRENDLIRVESIHAGMAIYREKEALVTHSPPSILSKYDAILLDECSQIDNSTARKVVYAIDELPQKPFVAIAADYQQLSASWRWWLYGSYLQAAAYRHIEYHLSH